MADDAYDIPCIDILAEEVELFFPKVVLPDVDLYPAASVSYICKNRFPMLAYDVDATGGSDLFFAFFVSDFAESLPDPRDAVSAVEGVGVDRYPAFAQALYLLDLCILKAEVFSIAHNVIRSIRPAALNLAGNPGWTPFRRDRAARLPGNSIYCSPAGY